MYQGISLHKLTKIDETWLTATNGDKFYIGSVNHPMLGKLPVPIYENDNRSVKELIN